MVGRSNHKPTFCPPDNIIVISNIKHIPLVKQELFLRQKYLQNSLSVRQISALTMSSRQTVMAYLELYNIPIRNEDKRRGRPIRYGERRVNGRIVPNHRELKVISKIKALRNDGSSYNSIAKTLNSMGIPTKTKKAKWYSVTVADVCKN